MAITETLQKDAALECKRVIAGLIRSKTPALEAVPTQSTDSTQNQSQPSFSDIFKMPSVEAAIIPRGKTIPDSLKQRREQRQPGVASKDSTATLKKTTPKK
jgi:hypothetical protein